MWSIPAWAGEPGVQNLGSRLHLTVYPRVGGGTTGSSCPSIDRRVYPRVGGGTTVYNNTGVVGHDYVRSIPAWAGEPGNRSQRLH